MIKKNPKKKVKKRKNVKSQKILKNEPGRTGKKKEIQMRNESANLNEDSNFDFFKSSYV